MLKSIVTPRVQHRDAHRLKVRDIPSYQLQTMNQCRGWRDQSVSAPLSGIGHMQSGAPLRNIRIHRQNPSFEGGKDVAVNPAA